jgi:hypothetical protein
VVIAGATQELYFSPPGARAVRSFVVVVLGGGGVMVLWSLLCTFLLFIRFLVRGLTLYPHFIFPGPTDTDPASRARLQNLFFPVPIEHPSIIIHPSNFCIHSGSVLCYDAYLVSIGLYYFHMCIFVIFSTPTPTLRHHPRIDDDDHYLPP